MMRPPPLVLDAKMETPGTPPNIPGRIQKATVRKRRESIATRAREFLSAVVKGNLLEVSRKMSPQALKIAHPNTGSVALILAVLNGHKTIVEAILAYSLNTINMHDNDGRTALHYAAALVGLNQDPSLYFILMEKGAKDNLADSEGFTAQDVRTNPGLIDMDRARYANVYPVPRETEWELRFASKSPEEFTKDIINGVLDMSHVPNIPEHLDLIKRLTLLQSQVLGIWDAVAAEDERSLKQLICEKRMGLVRDRDGRTPLHHAYIKRRNELIDYLLYICPESADIKDKHGKTPIEYSPAKPPQLLEPPTTVVDTLLVVPNRERRPSRTDLLHKERFHLPAEEKAAARKRSKSENNMRSRETESPEGLEPDVLSRIQNIDIKNRDYTVLEQLQIEGKGDQIWRAAKRSSERLSRHVQEFRQLQNRLGAAIDAIEKDDRKKLDQTVDEDVMKTRDRRGMRLLHIAVLREKHEFVEHLAVRFSNQIDLTDTLGRTALHYAAAQQNAIYDSLVDLGARKDLPDQDGVTAEEYRQNPSRLVRPTSAVSSVMLRSMSTDDEFFDPDAPSEEQVEEWLETGEVLKLEQIVLDGRGHMLKEKKTVNAASNEFLSGLTQYLTKIDAIHKAVEEGDVRRVKSLIDRPLLSTARDNYGMTPIHKALLHGQTNTVRFLLGRFPSCVNATDHAGRTPLHYAAADPNGEHMIKVLQKSGGDAFIEDKHSHTPFYYRTHGQRLNVRSMKDNAVMNQLISGQLSRPLLQDLEEDIYDWIHTGNIGKLEELVLTGYADLLLGRNHEVEDADSIGFLEVLPQYQAKIQSIHKAVETGNLRAVKLLTDRKKLSLCRDTRGLSPLHKAIVFERTDIAKYLIRNYPQSVNAMDQKKRTPLHYAAALKDGGYLYKVMRKSGADPNIYDCNGRPAKYYLKHSGEIDLSAMRLDTRAALKQVLHNRVAPSYLESSIQQWLRDGQLAKLEQLVLSGCGDLLQSRTSSHTETQAFLDRLPDYMEKIDGIHKAIKEGNLDKVKELMKTKKLAIARDRFGCTPLHSAVVHEHTEIVRYIAGHYNSVLNAPDYNKRTAMHYAAAARDGGHYLKILGKAGADPMAVDNEGRTPDYYRRNAVIDLKLIKDRDEDYETINEEYLEDGPMIDSPATPDSGSEGSFADSARLLEDEDESIERHRFEKTFRGKIDLPTSENGVYLARTVAPVLTKALAEVLLRRPTDPIGFIAEWLSKYVVEVPRRNGNGH
ncbi:hypothetical protein GCK72_009735 [Caenorhabditis remanei]|uniref:Uncharacterized protein n=2 Tax=Caenorhabditis remanei TaxID=31234 RepID=A0A6A5H3C5_CAERE|nr:hypothetical protein GCK72_009735 [Caenorhabditis remanei]KAF1761479.1 hypothetical protein GCK72_009735 [Caenorhabditis remanei]